MDSATYVSESESGSGGRKSGSDVGYVFGCSLSKQSGGVRRKFKHPGYIAICILEIHEPDGL